MLRMGKLIQVVDARRHPDDDKSDEQEQGGLEVTECFSRLLASLNVGGVLSRAKNRHLRRRESCEVA